MNAAAAHCREQELELQHVWENFKPPPNEEALLDLGLLGGIFGGTVLMRTTSWYWYPFGQNLVNLGTVEAGFASRRSSESSRQ
jgi:hypothetical protein